MLKLDGKQDKTSGMAVSGNSVGLTINNEHVSNCTVSVQRTVTVSKLVSVAVTYGGSDNRNLSFRERSFAKQTFTHSTSTASHVGHRQRRTKGGKRKDQMLTQRADYTRPPHGSAVGEARLLFLTNAAAYTSIEDNGIMIAVRLSNNNMRDRMKAIYGRGRHSRIATFSPANAVVGLTRLQTSEEEKQRVVIRLTLLLAVRLEGKQTTLIT